MGATFSIILDQRYLLKKSQKYPLKLRVTNERKSKSYPTIYQLSSVDYLKLNAPRLSEDLLKVKGSIKTINTDVSALIEKMYDFSFLEFEKHYIFNNPHFDQVRFRKKYNKRETNTKSLSSSSDKPAPINLEMVNELEDEFENNPLKERILKRYPILALDFRYGEIGFVYQVAIKKLANNNCFGNADKFRDSFNNLAKFLSYKLGENKLIKRRLPVPEKSVMGQLRFSFITKSWLKSFERWMLLRGIRLATIGANIRSLCTIFNDAIHEKYIQRDSYPFGKRGYQIPVSRKNPKIISNYELKKLFEYQPKCEEEEYSLKFWFFMYFANGINPTDLFHLKPTSIDGNYLTFYRIKVQITQRKNPIKVRTFVNSFMWEIIGKYGQLSDKFDYIFPVEYNQKDELSMYEAIKKKREFIYRWMRNIGRALEIAIPLGPNLARHCSATNMKRSGLNHSYIQEALGHADIRTTEHYLSSFEDETKQKQAQMLTNFLTDDVADKVF